MASTSAIRIAILGVVLLGITLTITAIAEDEWETAGDKLGLVTVKLGLWQICEKVKGGVSKCSTIKFPEDYTDITRKFFKIYFEVTIYQIY